MANLSLREAVKHFDISRPTLLKDLKNGKISGVKDGKGQWEIATSELARVYSARPADPVKVDNALPDKLSTFSSPLPGEIDALKERLAEAEKRAAVAEALAEDRARHIDDLRRMLPSPAPAAPAVNPGRPWWRFWE